MTKTALVLFAPGFEELEAITVTDLLTRAGVQVTRAGLGELQIRASRNTLVVCDGLIEEQLDKSFDLIVLPGGLPGADHLADDVDTQMLCRQQLQTNALLGAICAAPKVLVKNNLISGRTITAYPGSLDALDCQHIKVTDEAIVVDQNLVTSRGPGTAMDFALMLIERLMGREAREQVEGPLCR